MKSALLKTVRASFRVTLPVMAGYLFLGLTFGLVVKTSGFPGWLPILMSFVIYSGALEFAAIPLMAASFDPIGALILGVTLSARHLFYGLPMLKKYHGSGAIKPFLIFGLTDETFSILSTTDAPDGTDEKKFYLFVTLFDYLYWTLGTALGAILGSTVTLDLSGLDFVLTALFVVLFLEQVKTKTGLKSGLIGLAVSALALILFGTSFFIPISMAAIALILICGKKVIDRD